MFDFLQSISAKNPNAGRGPEKPAVSVRERVSALRHLPAFLKLIWATSPALASANLVLRLLRAFLPLATLYVGRLLNDDVVALTKLPTTARQLTPVLTLVGLEFGLVLLAGGLVAFQPWLLLAVVPAFLGESHFNESSYSLSHSWTPERRPPGY